MNRIGEAFLNKKAFIAFLTAGDPTLEKTAEYIEAMEQAGADLIEIGIPFSDPVAEGPVIERANARALAKGATVDRIFTMVENVRKKVTVPLVFLTYFNPVFKYGQERFFAECAKVGIDGIIMPDLPFEESLETKQVAKKHGVDVISLIAPTSHERILMITKEASGFIYAVSSMGVTGVRSDIKTDLGGMINLVRTVTDVPVAVGFGISSPDQAKKVAEIGDGVIVGSRIVSLIEEYGENAKEPLSAYVKSMKEAVEKAM
jgi:tryptophan synthase, alpha subunit